MNPSEKMLYFGDLTMVFVKSCQISGENEKMRINKIREHFASFSMDLHILLQHHLDATHHKHIFELDSSLNVLLEKFNLRDRSIYPSFLPPLLPLSFFEQVGVFNCRSHIRELLTRYALGYPSRHAQVCVEVELEAMHESNATQSLNLFVEGTNSNIKMRCLLYSVDVVEEEVCRYRPKLWIPFYLLEGCGGPNYTHTDPTATDHETDSLFGLVAEFTSAFNISSYSAVIIRDIKGRINEL